MRRRQNRQPVAASISVHCSQALAWAVPLFALVAGLAGVYQHEQKQHIADLAELDAAVLSDELPLTAYLDDGFNAYLASQKRAQ
jgi:hypothetical protein